MTGTKIISGKMADEFKRFGFPAIFNFLTGAFEIIGALGMLIGIWIHFAAVFAGLLLGGTMFVAAFTLLLIVKDPFKKAVPAIILLILSIGVTSFYIF